MSANLPSHPYGDPAHPTPAPAFDAAGMAGDAHFDGSAGGGNPAGQLKRYAAAVLRRKWAILGLTALGTTAGILAVPFVKPQYEAQSTVWVETVLSDNTQGPIRTDELLQSTAWLELLRSYVVLDHVVRDQRLYIEAKSPAHRKDFAAFQLEPRFRPGSYKLTVDASGKSFILASAEGARVQEGRVGESVGQQAGFRWTPDQRVLSPKRVIEFTVLNPRDVAVKLSEEIKTSMAAKDGNFLRLTLAGTDPDLASQTLNAVVARYVDVAAQLKRAKLDELTAVLDEQRRYAEDNLRSAEIDLENFRVGTITLPSDKSTPVAPGLEVTRTPVLSRFFDMRVEREELRSEREAIERALAGAKASSVSLDALAMIEYAGTSPALKQALEERTQKRAELRALQQRYTSEYRPVQQLAQDLESLEDVTIPRLVMDLRAQLIDRETELDSRLSTASDELRQIPPRTIEEARLQRRVAIAENLHSTLKQRFEEARLAAASSIPDIRVLDAAVVPFEPVSDPRLALVLLGFAASLGLSISGVIVLDRFDPKVRYPEQVSAGLGLPILGIIPDVKQIATVGGKKTSNHAAEAFRELRMSLIHAHGTAGPILLCVSSPESGDGKSFLISNLALSFADQGYQTLVIDGDIRRGGMHRVLGGQRTPGLTDMLAGTATEDEIIQETSYPGVRLISAGTRMQNGPELLGSPAMAQLILRLRSRFGAILIDSPPLGAGVDAYALGTLTRNMLLVLRTGTTNREFAEAKISLLDRLPIRVLGAVLNGTSDSSIYRYYSYLSGYEAVDENSDAHMKELAGA